MSMFPDTPVDLLRKIADLKDCNDEAVWCEFVEMYQPLLFQLIHRIDAAMPETEVEDAVQDIFIRLVGVLRNEEYKRTRAKFRTYLVSMTRNLLIDRYRTRASRLRVADALLAAVELGAGCAKEDPAEFVDREMRASIHARAVELVLSQPMMPDLYREVYRAYVVGEEEIGVVASRFKLSRNAVSQIKVRLNRAIAAIERKFLGE